MSQNNLQNDKNNKKKGLTVEDGFKTAHFTRIIKALEFLFLIVNCVGFFLLVLDDIFKGNLLTTHTNICYTYLVAVQLFLEGSMIYLRIQRGIEEQLAKKQNQLKVAKQNKLDSEAETAIFNFFKAKWTSFVGLLPQFIRLHVLLILLQPCIFWPSSVNFWLLKLTSIRLYVIMRFYLVSNEMQNSRFKRIMNMYAISVDAISNKLAFSSKHYFITVCLIWAFLIFGLGTIVSDKSQQSFMSNVFQSIYFVIITGTTVGYGDIIVSDPADKILNAIIIVISICMNSLLTVTVLSTFTMNKQEQNAYFLRRKLDLSDRQKEYISERLSLLLDMSEMQNQIESNLTERQYQELQKYDVSDTNVGQVTQNTFELLVRFKPQSSRSRFRSIQWREILDAYFAENDDVVAIRAEMDELNAIDPITGTNLDSEVIRIKHNIRALRGQNNLINQLFD